MICLSKLKFSNDYESLESEVNILKTLDSSPYTVQCLGSERDGGNLNVLMEYMAGGSLANVAEKFGGSLEEEIIRLYTKEILQGLKYLHQHGIVHCDLKCKNVLMGSSGDIKLADFGCAKRVKDFKVHGGLANSLQSISGTPLWMALEVLRNEKLDFAADIWSLGCTIIEMATGKVPWGSDVSNPMATLLKIACGNDLSQFPTYFSDQGLDLLTRCFERNPRKRWTTEELLRHPFVSSNPSTPPSQKGCAYSPASVLGIQSFEDTSDLDEPESPDENDFSVKNPFMWLQGEDSGFGSSDNWITVISC